MQTQSQRDLQERCRASKRRTVAFSEQLRRPCVDHQFASFDLQKLESLLVVLFFLKKERNQTPTPSTDNRRAKPNAIENRNKQDVSKQQTHKHIGSEDILNIAPSADDGFTSATDSVRSAQTRHSTEFEFVLSVVQLFVSYLMTWRWLASERAESSQRIARVTSTS